MDKISSKKSLKIGAKLKKAPVTRGKRNTNATRLDLRGLERCFDDGFLGLTSNKDIYTSNYSLREELKRLSFKIKSDKKTSKINIPSKKSDLPDTVQNFFNFFALTDISFSSPSSPKKDVANERSGRALALPATSELVTIDDAQASSPDDTPVSSIQVFPFTLNLSQETLQKIERDGLAFVSAKLMQRQLRRHLKRTVDIAFAFEYVERRREEGKLHIYRGMNPHIHGVVLLRHEELEMFKTAMISFNVGDKTTGFKRHEFSYKMEGKSRAEGILKMGYILNDLKYSNYVTKGYDRLKAIYRTPEGEGLVRRLASKFYKVDNTIHGSLLYCSKNVSMRATKIYNDFIQIHNEMLTDTDFKKQFLDVDLQGFGCEGFEGVSEEEIQLTEEEIILKEIEVLEQKIEQRDFFKSDGWKRVVKRKTMIKHLGISKYDYKAQSHYGIYYHHHNPTQ